MYLHLYRLLPPTSMDGPSGRDFSSVPYLAHSRPAISPCWLNEDTKQFYQCLRSFLWRKSIMKGWINSYWSTGNIPTLIYIFPTTAYEIHNALILQVLILFYFSILYWKTGKGITHKDFPKCQVTLHTSIYYNSSTFFCNTTQGLL